MLTLEQAIDRFNTRASGQDDAELAAEDRMIAYWLEELQQERDMSSGRYFYDAGTYKDFLKTEREVRKKKEE